MDIGDSKRTLLTLIEIIISICIFAIATVLTLQLFLYARFLTDKTSDTAAAIFEIQNIAEEVKLLSTVKEAQYFMEEDLSASNDSFVTLYYDKDWKRTIAAEGLYFMNITIERTEYKRGDLYGFNLDLYKKEPYPFIDNKHTEKDEDYIPHLASITANKFVYN